MRVNNELFYDNSVISAGEDSVVMALEHECVADVTASITASNPANKTFAAAAVNVTNNTATITAHGYLTGLKVQVSNPGTLPTGISAATDYYVIKVDADTIKFATSQANALAGTAVDITAAGAGTNTVEVVTTIAGSVKLQKNNFPNHETAVWFDITSSSQNFTGTTTLNWSLADIGYRQLRAVVTVTSGTVTVRMRGNAKGV